MWTTQQLSRRSRQSCDLHNKLTRQYHNSLICSSERLLGHSPMAPGATASPTASNMSAIPTAQDVTTSGGVWAPTSAKRDKLGELQAALEPDERTLDDAASPEEKHDLWLCDGVASVVGSVDFDTLPSEDSQSTQVVKALDSWWESNLPDTTQQLAEIQFENMMKGYVKQIDVHLARFPPEACLSDVRDFFDVNTLNSKNPRYMLPMPEDENLDASSLSAPSTLSSFQMAAFRYRLLLVQAAAQKLQTSWKTLVHVSDHDVDRAAVRGESRESLKVSTISAEKLNAVLQAFLKGTAPDRVDTLWNLLDRDEDILLEEVEMNEVANLAVAPVAPALEKLLTEATEVSLVRPLDLTGTNDAPSPPPEATPKLSWRKRRQEQKQKKKLIRTLQKALKRHFVDEVEMPHRLRCIYAWANKAHQNNQIDSVLVENEEGIAGFGGRKRYVELPPKISLEEFREVQKEHFTHLDRVSAEYMKSYREDLWCLQGNGRQNRELYRDCAIFMSVVCATDIVISFL